MNLVQLVRSAGEKKKNHNHPKPCGIYILHRWRCTAKLKTRCCPYLHACAIAFVRHKTLPLADKKNFGNSQELTQFFLTTHFFPSF
jgi:hypothetical protein